jgi:hypothetical protein
MPVLARLQFCLIAMYFDDHNPPHFHILGHDGREAEVALAGLRLLKGEVDRRAMREAMTWAKANEDLLRETWHDFSNR